MFPYFFFLDSLSVPVSLIGFFCFFPAFISAFVIVFIALEEVIFLVSWSDIARPFCVLEEFDFSRFESRFTFDLRFFF
jgi:hypothetical protein